MKSKKSTPVSTPTPTDHKRTKRKTMHDPNTTVNINNHDVCDACGGHGQFLCCDACPNAFHFTCVEPPLTCDDVKKLKGDWYCNECKPRKTKVKHPDYNQLKDKNGKFRCCYFCRMTALKKPMIACDYCTLYWHLDCLTPPLTIPPNPARKWRCPNHFEHFIKPKREVRDPSATTVITTNDENRIPPSTFNQGLAILIEKELKELEDNKHVNNKPPKKVKTEDVIVSKTGTVYRLPVNPIKLNFSKFIET
ncbi:hypothetical protein HPULCUR_000651 [Helicostylum pulchrum]|uniref:PHD-type domain-containing protein n=1 Tax=Helicostylum pulchrum TaxID=562976 RepID=A0ABP9XKK9_9FUNG